MTDKDIIKALECCIGGDISKSQYEVCADCPFFYEGNCTDRVHEQALALINRQQAEIERYERENKSKFDKWKILDERTKERYADLYETAKGVVRAEAVKEFAERLKAVSHPYADTQMVFELQIDNLVKEMVGEG